MNPLWDNLYSFGQIFIVVDGQMLKKIWPSGHTGSNPNFSPSYHYQRGKAIFVIRSPERETGEKE